MASWLMSTPIPGRDVERAFHHDDSHFAGLCLVDDFDRMLDRNGQSHGDGGRRARHGRDGPGRRQSRPVGRAPHGPDRLPTVEVRRGPAIGHYATVAKNVPVECAGVTVRPGDIIVGDGDSVVVPQERAAEVLKQATSIDERESGMYQFIRPFKSLQQAIAEFNRI
jgi:hypothetical protein